MPQDELVDIVDENGKFIETVSKKEAHQKGLLHTCVIGQVINSKGEYLLITQSSNKQDNSLYVCPMGGHVTSGESREDAVRHELMEELSISEYTLEYIGESIFNRDVLGRKENHYFVLYKVFSDQIPKPDPSEVEGFKYFTLDELKNEIKNQPEKFGVAYHFVVNKFFPNLL